MREREMRVRLVMALALLALAVGGCSNPPTEGIVIRKEFKASYTWYEQVCVSYGTHGLCKMYMPFPHTEPDSYKICIRHDAQDTTHDATGCWDTDPVSYWQYRVGDRYPNRS